MKKDSIYERVCKLPREKIIVLAKTYPEVSSKYGPLVCVAGVTLKGEWRRLYPIQFKLFYDKEFEHAKFKKWDIIEVETTTAEHDPRRESRKVVDWRAIRPISHVRDWSLRLYITSRFLDPSIEDIVNSGKSLGIVKPRSIKKFYRKERARIRDRGELQVLERMEAVSLTQYIEMGDEYLLPEVKRREVIPEELPWLGYRFVCEGEGCKGHDMMVIDWEIQELYRKLRQERNEEEAFEKTKEKAMWMATERNLYFVVGNTWRYHKSFMIIGLIYPPKDVKPVNPLEDLFEQSEEEVLTRFLE